MSLRLTRLFGVAVVFAAGAALPPGTVGGDPGRVLATFLGLFSASILPTVTLVVNNMTANGRSVKALNTLHSELRAAMDALFFIFGCIIIAVGMLVLLSIPAPSFLQPIPYLTTEVMPRVGQALAVTATALVVWRAGQIPGILRRALDARHEIALIESRKKLEGNAPSSSGIKQAFKTHPEFGKTVSIDEVQTTESRQQ